MFNMQHWTLRILLENTLKQVSQKDEFGPDTYISYIYDYNKLLTYLCNAFDETKSSETNNE